MAKDTEKLIRQLSLISYLMAERRPVTALEIRRDVEGYSGMNEDAFARRFYADRSELESLGIQLTVDRPPDAVAEQENYSLRPEEFHLPAIAFTDGELAALGTALSLLDGEFAYAEPLRLALQQLSWGRPSPLSQPEQQPVALGITASAGGQELSQRLAKVETAIFRGKTILFDYYTMERDETGTRKVDPYHLLFQGGQFYLLGRAHDRDALRVFRLSRMRGKVAYATKAEHDFRRPTREEFDPREYASRAAWQFGETQGIAEVLVSERIAWQVSRHFGRFGEIRPGDDGSVVFATPYASARMVASWVLRLGEHVQVLGPPELEDEVAERVATLASRHADGGLELAGPADPRELPDADADTDAPSRRGQGDTAIRPERFARLVTLASVLIEAGRRGELLDAAELQERLQISDRELREDIDVLNVVSFGGGTYVLYAEVTEDGHVEVDPEPYADNFARPARLLPVEAKALVAAIDLIGEHLPEGALTSAREKIVAALGEDPTERGLQVASTGGDDSAIARVVSEAIAAAPDAAAGLLQAQRGRVRPADDRAVRAHERARGLVRRLVRPRARRRPPLPAGPHPQRGDDRGALHAPSRGRSGGRRRRLAAHRRGDGVADRARLGLARACALGPRGASRQRGAGGRVGHRRAAVQGRRLARARGARRGGRRGRAGARGRPRCRAGRRRAAARRRDRPLRGSRPTA